MISGSSALATSFVGLHVADPTVGHGLASLALPFAESIEALVAIVFIANRHDAQIRFAFDGLHGLFLVERVIAHYCMRRADVFLEGC